MPLIGLAVVLALSLFLRRLASDICAFALRAAILMAARPWRYRTCTASSSCVRVRL